MSDTSSEFNIDKLLHDLRSLCEQPGRCDGSCTVHEAARNIDLLTYMRNALVLTADRQRDTIRRLIVAGDAVIDAVRKHQLTRAEIVAWHNVRSGLQHNLKPNDFRQLDYD